MQKSNVAGYEGLNSFKEAAQSTWLKNANAFKDRCKELVGLDLSKVVTLSDYDTAFWNLHDATNLGTVECKCCSGLSD